MQLQYTQPERNNSTKLLILLSIQGSVAKPLHQKLTSLGNPHVPSDTEVVVSRPIFSFYFHPWTPSPYVLVPLKGVHIAKENTTSISLWKCPKKASLFSVWTHQRLYSVNNWRLYGALFWWGSLHWGVGAQISWFWFGSNRLGSWSTVGKGTVTCR